MKQVTRAFILGLAFAAPSFAAAAPAPETPAERQARMAWWHEAKFGMFIHFGLYAIPGKGEWYLRNKKVKLAEYDKLAEQFNPTLFDPDAWLSVAREAGMKYMVITSKHHDGFALFDTKVDDWSIARTPFKKDIIGALAEAAPRHDIRFGVYYSAAADWHHPGGGSAGELSWDEAQKGDNLNYINNVALPQVRELLTNYGPLAEIWFDTDGARMPKGSSQPIHDLLALQPQIISNNRLSGFPGDFDTPEAHLGALRPLRADWEACTTMTGSWGYQKKATRPVADLLRQMIDIVSKGGNNLLNVGPQPDGQFPADCVAALREIGAWLKVNGESIYGTTAGSFDYLSWGRVTRKGDLLYLHVFDWPKDGVIHLPLGNKVVSASFLTQPSQSLPYQTEGNRLSIRLPEKAPDAISSVIVLKIEGEPPRTQSLALNKPATVSASSKGKAADAIDNDPKSRWILDPGTSGWLQVDLQKPTTFSTVRISHSIGDFKKLPIKKYQLEYKEGETWKVIFEGTDLPIDEFVRSFPPVTAQVVRLNVLEAEKAIDVASFELFPPE